MLLCKMSLFLCHSVGGLTPFESIVMLSYKVSGADSWNIFVKMFVNSG